MYAKPIADHPDKPFVYMGDSAGGGLALGFSMKIRDEGLKQPDQMILFSPWLDVTMTNPGMIELAKRDKILSMNGLQIAGKNYAGDLPLTDYRVSPIYGDFSKLGRISIGTEHLRARRSQSMCQYFHGCERLCTCLFLDRIVVSQLMETKDMADKISKIFTMGSCYGGCPVT